MIRMPYEQILEKILESKDISKEELESRIKQKMSQLSGLISKEGAAHIVANELNVKLFEAVSGKLQIKHILAGMRSVEAVGKVTQVFEVRQFDTGTRSGTVASFTFGDETGTIRAVLWGNQTDSMRKLQPGVIVKVMNGYVRDNNGRPEVHLNDRSKLLINPPGETVNVDLQPHRKRKAIIDIKDGDDQVELFGTIVQVYDPRFFEVCPECGKRVRNKDESWICNTHQSVRPAYSYVFNFFLDDGTENVRVVCFSNQATQLLGKSDEDIQKLREFPERFEDDRNELPGKMIKVTGRVRNNANFNRLEFISQGVITTVDPDEEIQHLKEQSAQDA